MAIFQDVADDFADALRVQYKYIDEHIADPLMKEIYRVQLRDDTIAIANVIHRHGRIHVDMDEFYRRAGYQGTHPVH